MGIKEDFQEATPGKVFMAGIVLAAIYYFVGYNSGADIINNIATQQAEIQNKEKRLENVQRAISNKEEYEREAKKLQREMEDLLVYMPAVLDMNAFQEDLTQRIQSSNSKVESMKGVEVESRFEDYKEQGLEIQISGGFHNIMSFLSEVTKMNRVVDFKDFELLTAGPGEQGMSVQFKGLLSVFSKAPDTPVKKETK